MSALNENIRALRMARGLSQVEFAERLGVTKQCVSNWENDNVLPSIEMLIKLSDFLGVTTDHLLGRAPTYTISIDGLTSKQIVHLQMVIADFQEANAEVEKLKTVIKYNRIHNPHDRS